MVRVASCRFMRLSCSEEDHPLFRRYYVRSNREKGVKLLRCFPHCCPEHASRSYCGCSVHVMVTFADDNPPKDLDNIVVCARFEPSWVTLQKTTNQAYMLGDEICGDIHEQRLQPGEVVALPSGLIDKRQSEQQNTWVRADRESDTKQKLLPKNAVLYVLNNHRLPTWQYSYDSSVTSTQREMAHHLVVYVFYLVTAAPSDRAVNAMVLSRQESPSFSLVSYRRSRHDSSDAGCNIPALDLPRSSKFVAASFTPNEVEIESSRTTEEHECKRRVDPVTHTSNLTEKGQHLVILWRFIQFVSLNDIGFEGQLVQKTIRAYWLRAAGDLRCRTSYQARVEAEVHSFLKDLAKSSTNHSAFSSPMTRLTLRRDITTIRVSGYLFLRALASHSIQRQLQFTGENHGAGDTSISTSREEFGLLIASVYDALGHVLRQELVDMGDFSAQHIVSSIPELVDEVLSVVYGQTRFNALRPQISSLLLKPNAPGSLSDTLDSLFEGFKVQVLENATIRPRGCPPAMFSAKIGDLSGLNMWNHRFLLDPGSVRVSSLTSISTDTLIQEISLVDVAQLAAEVGCVDIQIAGNAASLSLRSALLSAGNTPMTLVLDSQLHIFQVTPGGVSTMLSMASGWSIGDYRAKLSRDTHTLNVDFFAITEDTRAINSREPTARNNSMLVRWVSLAIALEEEIDAGNDTRDLFAFVRGTVCGSTFTVPNGYVRNRSSTLNLLKTTNLGQTDIWSEVEWRPLWELQAGYIAL